MTPVAVLAFALVVTVPPVAPDGGTDDASTGAAPIVGWVQGDRVGAARGEAAAGGVVAPGNRDGDDGELLPPLYVHALDKPAVDVTGLDPQFLAESVSIARCESTMREGAVNRSGATGLMQIMLPLHLPKANRLGYTRADMLRAEPNLRVAHTIWKRQGWAPWSCSPSLVAVPVVGGHE